MSREEWIARYPDFPWLRVGDPAGTERFLRQRGWIEPDEPVRSADRAGEGNMNLTLLIVTDRRRFVLKQARPWVEKYDAIDAPWNRMASEQAFYGRVREIAGVGDRMPRLLGSDEDSASMAIAYLEGARDFTDLYWPGATLSPHEIDSLARFLRDLHEATEGSSVDLLPNDDMRRLNHEYVFRVPLDRANGLDLDAIDEGLADAAAELIGDADYRRLVEETGEAYLSDAGGSLLHGDFFPGSWLRTPEGPIVIDPEFGFVADRALDVGCAIAHFALAAQPIGVAERFLEAYGGTGGRSALTDRFAATEAMRRLIGVARVPTEAPAGFRVGLLWRSRRAMLGGNWRLLWEG